MQKPQMQICPSCKMKSLSFIEANGRFECFNPKCRQSFLPIELERYNRQIEEDKKDLDEIPTKGNGPWVGNQYYNANKKKWINGGKSSHHFSGWYIVLVIVLVFIVGLVFWGDIHPNQNNLNAAIPTQATTTTDSAVAQITAPTAITQSGSAAQLTITSATINSYTGTYGNYYLGLVSAPDGNLIAGDGCYDDQGDFIVLINNKNATNPTYAQMVNFLQNDTTDEYPYLNASVIPGSYYLPAENDVDLTRIKNIIDGTAQPSNPRVCSDFAERLHNDAEMAGIRCAYVSIDLSTGEHAIDAFQTTDEGLIYIDDTGPSQEPHSIRAVKTVDLQVGSEFTPVSLFSESGWNSTYESIGTVIDFKVIWDGTWNNQSR